MADANQAAQQIVEILLHVNPLDRQYVLNDVVARAHQFLGVREVRPSTSVSPLASQVHSTAANPKDPKVAKRKGHPTTPTTPSSPVHSSPQKSEEELKLMMAVKVAKGALTAKANGQQLPIDDEFVVKHEAAKKALRDYRSSHQPAQAPKTSSEESTMSS